MAARPRNPWPSPGNSWYSMGMPRDRMASTTAVEWWAGTMGSSLPCSTTNAPSMVQKIGAAFAAKGIPMLDAPVSGGTTGAEAATIAIMVGGDKKVFDDALPVLQSFSANVLYMGGLGSGTVTKLCNNMLSFCNMAALCEAMMLGTGYGLDPEKLLNAIANSSGNSNAIKNFTLRPLKSFYNPPSFALDLAYKDLHLALELGTLPTDLAKTSAYDHGEADAFLTALCDDIRHVPGLQHDHRNIHGAIYIGDGCDALIGADLAVLGVYRINAALITVAFQRQQSLAPGTGCVRIGANHGNAAGVEHAGEIGTSHA